MTKSTTETQFPTLCYIELREENLESFESSVSNTIN